MPLSHPLLIAVAAASLLVALRSQAAEAAAQPVQAIWKSQEIVFYLNTVSTFYSCDALQNKLKRLLRHLGVTGEVRVSDPYCPPGVSRMPRVRLRVVSPVPATPEALAERDEDKSTRELAARVNGKKAAEQLQASLEQFPAQWKPVSLSRGKHDVGGGDCELIDELSRKVLPKLSVRIVNANIRCTPYQTSLLQPRLEVEALIASPKPDDPAAGKKDDDSKLEVTLDPR